MNTNDLNTALYEKMAAEQDKFRDWLKSQPPEEVLNHAYEYTIREDIVMAMEELELTDTQAQALLESPSPLTDVYRYFEKLETGYMGVIRDSIESRADDVCRAKKELLTTPVYPYSAAYASEHGEMAQYNRSYQANSACKEAIEQTISAHYAENRLDTEAAVKDVLEKFGTERVQFILANTIQHKNHDGRISQDNKAWAKTIPMPEDSDASRHCAYLVVDIRLVDLPGTYSLTSYTMEEQVSRQFILSDEVDVIIDVADASALERNLYLTLQLLELGKPVVLALNMMDIVEKRGMEIDTHRLPEMLGIPVIPVSARKRTGLDVLLHAAAHHKDCKDPECLIHHHKYTPKHRHDHHSEYAMVYSDAIEDKIDLIMAELKRKYPNLSNYRWHAIKLLEQDKEISARYPVNMPDVIDRNYESDIINEKYDFIEEIIREVLVNKDRQDALTEKADRVLTHKFWSIPIFLVVMAAVFFLTFTIGDWLKGFLELGIESLSALISDGLIAVGVNEVLRSLLVDGIIAGVGGILTFLPNIFILFLALAFLEDSGYMARVAYVMEGIMSKLGLSGRAFIPMILGFGCTVPAIMASRSLENRRDRFKVMLITPFMSCSARLPIYILFAEMFFQERAMLVAYSMYLIGLVVAILVAAIIHLIDRRKSENYLLIELPEYKAPSARTVAIYVWEKVKDYLTKAGTTIFVASILMWVILNFGPHGYTTEMADSFGSILGHWLVPIFAPIGLGFWQIAVALIAGISAKEVVVSSCAVLFGIPNINSGAGMDTLVGILGAAGFGQLNAFCLMIFCLLYVPCAAALATIRKESGSTRWMLFSALFQLVVAWAVTFVVYRVGLLL